MILSAYNSLLGRSNQHSFIMHHNALSLPHSETILQQVGKSVQKDKLVHIMGQEGLISSQFSPHTYVQMYQHTEVKTASQLMLKHMKMRKQMMVWATSTP